MEPVSIAVTVASTIAGIVGSWLITRYYYLKAKPGQTSASTFIAAIQKEYRAQGPGGEVKRNGIPLKWALALIEAFEKGEIFMPELQIAARAINGIGEMILATMKSASEAAARAGITLSPPWQETYRRVVCDGLAALKADLKRKLRH